MPARRRRLSSNSARTPAVVAKAKRMAERLLGHYRLGQTANRQSKLSTVEFAAKHGLNENTMRKIRAFAREYSEAELDEICRQTRPNGLPLHWGYVPTLLSVQSKGGKSARQKFQRLAIKHGWTVPKLREAIRERYGGKGGHGRALKPPTDLRAGIRQVVADAETLSRGCRALAVLAAKEGQKSMAAKLRRFIAGLRLTLG